MFLLGTVSFFFFSFSSIIFQCTEKILLKEVAKLFINYWPKMESFYKAKGLENNGCIADIRVLEMVRSIRGMTGLTTYSILHLNYTTQEKIAWSEKVDH